MSSWTNDESQPAQNFNRENKISERTGKDKSFSQKDWRNKNWYIQGSEMEGHRNRIPSRMAYVIYPSHYCRTRSLSRHRVPSCVQLLTRIDPLSLSVVCYIYIYLYNTPKEREKKEKRWRKQLPGVSVNCGVEADRLVTGWAGFARSRRRRKKLAGWHATLFFPLSFRPFFYFWWSYTDEERGGGIFLFWWGQLSIVDEPERTGAGRIIFLMKERRGMMADRKWSLRLFVVKGSLFLDGVWDNGCYRERQLFFFFFITIFSFILISLYF